MDLQSDVDEYVSMSSGSQSPDFGDIARKAVTGTATSALGLRTRKSAETARGICDKFGKDVVVKEHGLFQSPGQQMERSKQIWATW